MRTYPSMSRHILARVSALAALAACLCTPSAFAYPNAEQKHVVSANGASWTVLQDHKNPLRWYYVPAMARLVENGKGDKAQPELALIRYQTPSPSDRTRMVENTLLFLTLSLVPDEATLDQLAGAIGNLKPMMDAKAASTAISLEEIALENIKLKLPEGQAEAVATVGFGLPIPASAVQFALHLPAVETLEKLRSQPHGLKAQLEFTYAAGTPKPGGQLPALTSFSAQATGTVGLGAYPKRIQDSAILIVPAGEFNFSIFKLPPVAASSDIGQITYSVAMLGPDGKPVSGMPTQTVASKPSDGTAAWQDKNRRPTGFLFFPIKALPDQARKAGKKLEDYSYYIEAAVISSNRRTEKYTSDARVFTHGAPITLPPPPVASLRLSPEFLDSEATDTACVPYAVQGRLACGRHISPLAIRRNAKDGSFGPPPTFLFDRTCGNVKLERATLICKDGKKQTLPGKELNATQGTTMYLGY